MKNRPIIALLTVIAVLLGANLIVTTAAMSRAQDLGSSVQPERPERPQRPQTPAVRDQDRPTRPGVPQRPPRCVGITTAGNVVVLAFDDGTIETREVPAPQSR